MLNNPTPQGLTNTEIRATPLPISGTVAVTGAGDASAANQVAGNASLTTIAAKDFATQTTLAAVLAKIIAAPATEATLVSIDAQLALIKAKTDNLDASLASRSSTAATQPVAIIGTPTVEISSQPIQVSGTVTATTKATASTSDPLYTEAASSALSQTLDGFLRVLSTLDPARNNIPTSGLNPSGSLGRETESSTRKSRLSWDASGSQLY